MVADGSRVRALPSGSRPQDKEVGVGRAALKVPRRTDVPCGPMAAGWFLGRRGPPGPAGERRRSRGPEDAGRRPRGVGRSRAWRRALRAPVVRGRPLPEGGSPSSPAGPSPEAGRRDLVETGRPSPACRPCSRARRSPEDVSGFRPPLLFRPGGSRRPREWCRRRRATRRGRDALGLGEGDGVGEPGGGGGLPLGRSGLRCSGLRSYRLLPSRAPIGRRRGARGRGTRGRRTGRKETRGRA